MPIQRRPQYAQNQIWRSSDDVTSINSVFVLWSAWFYEHCQYKPPINTLKINNEQNDLWTDLVYWHVIHSYLLSNILNQIIITVKDQRLEFQKMQQSIFCSPISVAAWFITLSYQLMLNKITFSESFPISFRTSYTPKIMTSPTIFPSATWYLYIQGWPKKLDYFWNL